MLFWVTPFVIFWGTVSSKWQILAWYCGLKIGDLCNIHQLKFKIGNGISLQGMVLTLIQWWLSQASCRHTQASFCFVHAMWFSNWVCYYVMWSLAQSTVLWQSFDLCFLVVPLLLLSLWLQNLAANQTILGCPGHAIYHLCRGEQQHHLQWCCLTTSDPPSGLLSSFRPHLSFQ